MGFNLRNHDRIVQALMDFGAEIQRETAAMMLPPPRPVLHKLQVVDGWDMEDGLPKLQVTRVLDEKTGINFFKPLTKFLPQYKGSWQERTIDEIFGRANVMVWPSVDAYRDWQLLKAEEGKELTRITSAHQPGSDCSRSQYSGQTGAVNSAKGKSAARGFGDRYLQSQPRQIPRRSPTRVVGSTVFTQRACKRRVSVLALEEEGEQNCIKRPRYSDTPKGQSMRNTVQTERSIEADIDAARLAEERFQRNQEAEAKRRAVLLRCSEYYTLDELMLELLGQPRVNDKRPMPTGYIPKPDVLQHNSKAAWKIANGEEAELFYPWRECPGLPLAGWLELFAPEAMPFIFPITFFRLPEGPNVEREPLPVELSHGIDFTGGPNSDSNDVTESGAASLGMTVPATSVIRKGAIHFDGDVAIATTNTQYPASSPLASECRASTDCPSVDFNKFCVSLTSTLTDMVSEKWVQERPNIMPVNMGGEIHTAPTTQSVAGTITNENTAQVPQDLTRHTVAVPRTSTDDQEFEQLQRRIEEADDMAEAMCREFDLSPEQLAEYLASNGFFAEAGSLRLLDRHILANLNSSYNSAQAPVEGGSNSAIAQMQDVVQQGSGRPSPQPLSDVIQHHRPRTIAAPAEGGDNEADFDMNDFFDWDKFDRDNEAGNLDWTGRKY